uniref:Uncharacterized protein n=1 Tax=Rhizophora mucronata TaxID=61149 RepID=A0A2P2II60_RHIMU
MESQMYLIRTPSSIIQICVSELPVGSSARIRNTHGNDCGHWVMRAKTI